MRVIAVLTLLPFLETTTRVAIHRGFLTCISSYTRKSFATSERKLGDNNASTVARLGMLSKIHRLFLASYNVRFTPPSP